MFKVSRLKWLDYFVIVNSTTEVSDFILLDLCGKRNRFKTEKQAQKYCDKLNKLFY